MKKFIILFSISTIMTLNLIAQQPDNRELTSNGAWCWFSDPRAIYTNDKDVIVTGWVTDDGTVESASLDLNTNDIKTTKLYEKLQYDDHNNPAFVMLPDDNILAMYTWHSTKKGVVYNITSNPSDISSFGAPIVFKPKTEQLLKDFPKETYTYANPYILKKEQNRIYSFGRWIGYKPNMVVSDDFGKTWHTPRVIISPKDFDSNNRPYVKYYSDGKSKVHLTYTDGHPNVEPSNSIYYCYYEKGAFWRADGKKICTLDELPFEPEEATLVYKPSKGSGKAWNSDIAIDKKGQPVILYTRYPKNTDHRYHYTWYDRKKAKWMDYEICRAGSWFPQDVEGKVQREANYMGNMSVHPEKTNVIYLSREIGGVFEIEKRTTFDGGKTWEIEPLTSNSSYDNVRPYIPRRISKKDKTVVLWMENKKYIHYTNYDVAIKYHVEN